MVPVAPTIKIFMVQAFLSLYRDSHSRHQVGNVLDCVISLQRSEQPLFVLEPGSRAPSVMPVHSRRQFCPLCHPRVLLHHHTLCSGMTEEELVKPAHIPDLSGMIVTSYTVLFSGKKCVSLSLRCGGYDLYTCQKPPFINCEVVVGNLNRKSDQSRPRLSRLRPALFFPVSRMYIPILPKELSYVV